MDTQLTAALACAAALSLGACAGGNPSAPSAPETEMAGPETAETETVETETPDPGTGVPESADPPEDGRTEAERFDDELAEAEADLAAARNRVPAAAAAAAGTGGDRTRALADIAAARKALTDALAAARALRAPPDDSGRIARAARLALKAGAAEAEDLPRLRAAASSAGWAGSSALVIGRENLRPVPEIDVVRNRRRNADGTDKATLLTEDEIPAVPYDEGKVVMSPGLASSGDRLRMRGIPVASVWRAQSGNERRFLLLGTIVDSPRQPLDPVGGGNDGVEPKLVAGLRITPGGLVVDMGGQGAEGLDFRLPEVFATTVRFVVADGSNGGYDLKLTFGPPAASPEGNAEHYWTAALMPNSELAAAIGSSRLRDGQELGTYTMRLSNHVGLDRNLEYPDDPAAYTRDDVNRYLSHAAYGHMEFVHSFLTGIIPGRRTFPFHAGYDAFKDDAGMRTMDVSDADRIAGGTFKGRTLASQFGVTSVNGIISNYPQLSGANYLRLRGDVTLTATISGTAADNRISGKIENLESFSSGEGIWEDYARISGALTLQATGIDASGEFKGVVDTASLPAFAEGGYKGNFYGPLADLEAAGIWYLQDGDAANTAARNLSIVGSFGAALVREDGSYGVEVGPVGN